MATAPAKRAPRKTAARPAAKKNAVPGDPGFDWRQFYPNTAKLFKFTSSDGFVVCLPEFKEPGEGEVFGLMLMDKSDQDLLLHVMRESIVNQANDGQQALVTTFEALKKMRAEGTVEKLLEEWPAAAGIKLEK